MLKQFAQLVAASRTSLSLIGLLFLVSIGAGSSLASADQNPAEHTPTRIDDTPINALAYRNDLLSYTEQITALYYSDSSKPLVQGGIQARGLGHISSAPHYTSPLILTVNGHQRNQANANLLDWIDIERVTWESPTIAHPLRSSTAGSLLLTTITPELSSQSISSTTSVGNFGSRRITSTWNHSFEDNISAMRIAASYRESNGSIESTDAALNSTEVSQGNNRERFAIRGQYLLESNDNIRFHLNIDYAKTSDHCCSTGFLTSGDTLLSSTPSTFSSGNYYDAAGVASNGGLSATGQTAFNKRKTNGQFQKITAESANYSLESQFNFADIWLRYSPSYSELDNTNREDSDFSALNASSIRDTSSPSEGGEIYHRRATSHQISLSNNICEKLFWEIGGFYENNKSSQELTTVLGSDYQTLQSAVALSKLEALSSEAVSQGLYIDSNAFYANFASMFPGLDPTTSTHIALNASSGFPAENNFATNKFTRDGSATSLYVKNVFKATNEIKLDWSIFANINKTKNTFQQLANNAAACSAALSNGDLQNLFNESENSANPERVNTAYSELAITLSEGACPASIAAIGSTDLYNNEISSEFSAFHKSAHWNAHFGAEVRISDQTVSWLRFANKTKSGGINHNPASSGLGVLEYKKERHHVYELGVKTTLNNAINSSAEITLFHHDIRDLQIEAPRLSSAQTRRWRGNIINLDKAMSSGFNINVSTRLYTGLSGSFGYSYIDARSGSSCVSNPNLLAAYSQNQFCNKRISQTPESQANLTLNFSRKWNENINWALSGELIYAAERDLAEIIGFEENIDLELGSTLKTNLYLTLNGTHKGNPEWKLSIYGINLSDEQLVRNAFQDTSRPGAIAAYYDEPRQFGVALELGLN